MKIFFLSLLLFISSQKAFSSLQINDPQGLIKQLMDHSAPINFEEEFSCNVSSSLYKKALTKIAFKCDQRGCSIQTESLPALFSARTLRCSSSQALVDFESIGHLALTKGENQNKSIFYENFMANTLDLFLGIRGHLELTGLRKSTQIMYEGLPFETQVPVYELVGRLFPSQEFPEASVFFSVAFFPEGPGQSKLASIKIMSQTWYQIVER